MRFVHIGDSHLGLSQFSRLDEDGGNLRERLVYDHFLAGIDAIAALRPDVVVHSGDLFQSVRPRTQAYKTAFDAVARLGDAGIPLVVIAGNHDMRKSRYTTSPFELFQHHRTPVHAAFGSAYCFVDLGDTRFHLIPNLLTPEQYREEFDKIEPAGGLANVLVTHGLASSLNDRRLATVMEHEIDTTMLSPAFDYIALGHFHGQVQVADNAWYCGSQEYITYAETMDTKGALLVDLERGAVSHLDLPCTPMMNLGELDCSTLSSREIGDEIATRSQRAAGTSEPALAIITLAGIEKRVRQALDPDIIQEARDRFLYLNIAERSASQGTHLSGRRDLRGIDYSELFSEYVRGQGLGEERQRFVVTRGRDVIRSVMTEEGGDLDAPR